MYVLIQRILLPFIPSFEIEPEFLFFLNQIVTFSNADSVAETSVIFFFCFLFWNQSISIKFSLNFFSFVKFYEQFMHLFVLPTCGCSFSM